MGSCLSKQSREKPAKGSSEETGQEGENDRRQANTRRNDKQGQNTDLSAHKESGLTAEDPNVETCPTEHDEGRMTITVGEASSAPEAAKITLAEQAVEANDFDRISRETASEPAGAVGISPTGMTSSPTGKEPCQGEDVTLLPSDHGKDDSVDIKPRKDQSEETLPSTEETTLCEDDAQEESENVTQEDRTKRTVQMSSIEPVMVIVTGPTPDPSTASDLADHDEVSGENGLDDAENDHDTPELVTFFISYSADDECSQDDDNGVNRQYQLSLEPGEEGWVTCASFKAFTQQVENSTEIFVSTAENNLSQQYLQISLDGELDKNAAQPHSISFFAFTTEMPGTRAVYVLEKDTNNPSCPSISCISLSDDIPRSGWHHSFVFYAYPSG